MGPMRNQENTGSISPFCFPDLSARAGAGSADTGKVDSAFQRQFVGVRGESGGKAAEERFQPSWRNDAEPSRRETESYADVPDPYRQIIERLIAENRLQSENAYQTGLAEGRKEGLVSGREQGKREGYELGKVDGYQQGYEKGMLDGEALVLPVVTSFRQAIVACGEVKRQLHFDAQREALKLAMVIAKKIIVREAGVDPEAIAGVIRNALGMADSCVPIRMRVHPDVVDYCLNQRQLLSIPDEVAIVADPAFSPGDCILETETGDIDARVETQLQVLAEALEREIEMCRNAAGGRGSMNDGGQADAP